MRIRICLPNCEPGIEAGVWGKILLLILGSGVSYREVDGGSGVWSNVWETALELQCSLLESYCIIFSVPSLAFIGGGNALRRL
jgi:hypothetical protein